MSRTFQLIAKLSLHPVTAAIVLREHNGKSDYSVDIERRYLDANGTWRSTEALDATDMPLVARINGYTMQAVRAMFPTFFREDSAASEPPRGPPDFHEPELWQWNGAPDMENAFDEFQPTGQNGFHPRL